MLVLSVLNQLGLHQHQFATELLEGASRLLKLVLSLVGRMVPGAISIVAGDPTLARTLGLAGLKPEELVQQLREDGKAIDDIQEIRTEFAQLTQKAVANREPESRVVIFLDDLDRCLPDQAVWLLAAR